MYEVIFYKDRQGEEPVKEYLYDLLARGRTSKRERVLAKKIIAYIKALQQYGTRIGVPTVKHIDGKLWELRPLNNRIFFFYWQDDIFVLLHHFVKKTRQTPPSEIDKARSNLADFLERNEEQ